MFNNHITVATSAFHSARQINSCPNGHVLKNIHGHNFLATIRQTTADKDKCNLQKLENSLSQKIQKINYCLLNNILNHPSDENIAKWLQNNCQGDGIFAYGIQSTEDQGADVYQSEGSLIWRRYQIHAAHRLPNVPKGHKCGQMHGHTFGIAIHQLLVGPGDSKECDAYASLDQAWHSIGKLLNFNCLNDFVFCLLEY